MKLQVLVSSVGEDAVTLAERMNLESDAIIINQTDYFDYHEYRHKNKKIQCFELAERGVGLSRNNALLRADGDIVLFRTRISCMTTVMRKGIGCVCGTP